MKGLVISLYLSLFLIFSLPVEADLFDSSGLQVGVSQTSSKLFFKNADSQNFEGQLRNLDGFITAAFVIKKFVGSVCHNLNFSNVAKTAPIDFLYYIPPRR